ncbi:MAG: DUF2878 domain-containing protein [Casimicrobiaceae bacterium]
MAKLANFVAFQVGWFACVLGAGNGHPLAGTIVALAVMGVHVALARRPRSEFALLLAAASIGAVWDSLLAASGWLRYPNGVLLAGTAPYWIVALWALFATTLNVSLAWLKRRMWVAALFGAIGGPLSFLGGARLGALVFDNQAAALVALAAGWALLTPLLLRIAIRLDGSAAPVATNLRMESHHA